MIFGYHPQSLSCGLKPKSLLVLTCLGIFSAKAVSFLEKKVSINGFLLEADYSFPNFMIFVLMILEVGILIGQKCSKSF